MAEVETNFSKILRPFLKDAYYKMHFELDKRRRGRRIYNLDQLMQAASNRRSVFTPKSPVFKKPLPAAVIINTPAPVRPARAKRPLNVAFDPDAVDMTINANKPTEPENMRLKDWQEVKR